MIRVAIIDDHAMFRSGLASMIGREADMQVVGSFSTGQAALTQLSTQPADVTLVDINLPDIVGIQLAQRLHELHPKTGIVFVTMFSRVQTFGGKQLEAGMDYVSKDQEPEVLLKKIRDVFERIQQAPDKLPERTVLTALSNRESEILRLYHQGLGVVEIGHYLKIGKSTVSTHLKNIRAKLSVRDNKALK